MLAVGFCRNLEKMQVRKRDVFLNNRPDSEAVFSKESLLGVRVYNIERVAYGIAYSTYTIQYSIK